VERRIVPLNNIAFLKLSSRASLSKALSFTAVCHKIIGQATLFFVIA